ncbi:MAG: ABC transporter ATP-binding protein [Betaproteobacteria bacterium]|jgi:NitT/TauT family transport system ATP-binding protein
MQLEVERVALTYETSRGPLPALRDLSFALEEGEFVSVLGPSGCGKSSLLRLVTGLLRPTAGRIALAGVPVSGPRDDVGIVFQSATLLPWKSVLDNVLVPVRARGRVTTADTERAMEGLRTVGLERFSKHYPDELSGGMQQRVGIARAMLTDPRLLLMDEPFAALDAMTRETMMDELLRVWSGTGKSVLFITHSIPEAVYLSDRVLVMGPRPGHIVEELRIDLPRPRNPATMADARFGELGARLRDRFRLMADTATALAS